MCRQCLSLVLTKAAVLLKPLLPLAYILKSLLRNLLFIDFFFFSRPVRQCQDRTFLISKCKQFPFYSKLSYLDSSTLNLLSVKLEDQAMGPNFRGILKVLWPNLYSAFLKHTQTTPHKTIKKTKAGPLFSVVTHTKVQTHPLLLAYAG